MKEVDYFDYAIEGTSLKDTLNPIKNGKIIVIDSNGNYGSTFTCLDKLSRSKYVAKFNIRKKGLSRFLIEVFPKLFFKSELTEDAFQTREFGIPIEYIDISTVIFIDSELRAFKIPITVNEIVEMEYFSPHERYFLHESIKTKDIRPIKNYLKEKYNLEKKPSFLFKIFCMYDIFNEDNFNLFYESLGRSPYYYPKYGISSIVESICFKRSVSGYTYLINDSIDIIENEDKNSLYKVKINSSFGSVYAKKLIKHQYKLKTKYIRVLELNKELLDGNFRIYIERNGILEIIGLNSNAKVCKEGSQLIYLISDSDDVEIEAIDCFNIKYCDIISDITFKTVFDLD